MYSLFQISVFWIFKVIQLIVLLFPAFAWKMSEEEGKEKMNKMRKRIERDAYSVLLSFKDGASPKQVEQRMELVDPSGVNLNLL